MSKSEAESPGRSKRKRRWFQYRLRTLFVVVTIVAVACWYVASQWSIVRQREVWLAAHPFGPVSFLSFEEGNAGDKEQGPGIVRRWLGDEAESYVCVTDDNDRNEGRRLFPEANIYFASGH